MALGLVGGVLGGMMNYEPNTRQWMVGDKVLHDADSKHPYMLMEVIGFTRLGEVKTKYVNKHRPRTVYINRPAVLHDPARFGIDVTA